MDPTHIIYKLACRVVMNCIIQDVFIARLLAVEETTSRLHSGQCLRLLRVARPRIKTSSLFEYITF
jgi:hypothetical protein